MEPSLVHLVVHPVTITTLYTYWLYFQASNDPVEEAVKVNMHTVPIGGIKQNVLSMSVTQTKDVTNNRHHSTSSNISHTCLIPVTWNVYM